MIAESSFATVFGAAVAGGDDSLVHIARAAVRAGFAIVPNRPGTKQPMCTLSSREIKNADHEAQADAFEAGNPRWDSVRHACGVHHAITDDKVVDRVVRRLVRNYGRINLGVELHRSRVVVVDVDTEAENTAFRQAWFAATGEMPGSFTVATPGVEGDDPENWKHKHGGHYWFTLPEGVDLPRADGVYKDPTGWAMMWADRQVLVPPSVRPEGAYQLVGEPQEMPKWLLLKLLSYCVERKRAREEQERRKAERLSSGDADAAIDVWSADTPWSHLLESDGWYDTTVPDNCGCPIWTAPGVHASPKSATAHEPGCSRYDDSPGHAPLHIWTDNPPDWLDPSLGKTFTKIQYLANRDHGGNVAAACRSVDIAREGGKASELVALDVAFGQNVLGMTVGGGADPLLALNGASGQIGATPGTGTTPMTPLSPISAPETMNDAPTPPPVPTADDPVERAVLTKMRELWVLEEAKSRLREQRLASETEPIALVRGDEFLAVEDEDEQYLINSLWPLHGNVVLAAQRKSGKTTLIGNLLRSLCDGDNFLGRYVVTPPAGSIAVVDLEMSESKLRYWTRKQNIQNKNKFHIDSLRGKVATFDLLNDKTRARWVEQLGEIGTDVLILDCLRPLLDHLGLDENRDAGVVLSAFEALLAEAGIGQGLIVHHAGHDGSRSRGDSRLRDWPDAEWLLARTGDDDHSPRKFQAFGRDVDVPADLITFEPETNRLTLPVPTLGAGGSIPHAEVVKELVRVMAPLMGDSMSTNALVEALHGICGKDAVKAALNTNAGRVFNRTPGPRNSWQWQLSSAHEYYVPTNVAPDDYEGPHSSFEPL